MHEAFSLFFSLASVTDCGMEIEAINNKKIVKYEAVSLV